MVKNFSNSSALLKYAEDKDLYQNLVSQLQKDFVFANVYVDFSPGISPKELKTIVLEKVYYLIMEKFTDYLNLLYIVDVPEKVVKAIEATDVVEISEKVTFEILKREWQKVWFRQEYGS